MDDETVKRRYHSVAEHNSRKRSTRSTNDGPSRSVVDFDTHEQMKEAMLSMEQQVQYQPVLNQIAENQPIQKIARTGEANNERVADALDWVLPTFDPATTEAQTMDEELKRLQVLKSYLILDQQREQAFERITALASRIFDVPIALISLVDLGRQWFMSNLGLGDARETPRKFAFCAHAILSKDNILIVPDAQQDFRFRHNPLVTGPPHIRFYAGAPLVSPEGYKLGTFCIIDSKPWLNGLNMEQQDTLRDLADMTMKVMVDRRQQIQKRDNASHVIAYTARDLMTPLSGVQMSLSLLKEDESVQAALNEHQLELLNTAASCSDLMVRICQNSLEGLGDTAGQDASSSFPLPGSLPPPPAPGMPIHITEMDELVRSLHMIIEPIPKKVPCVIKLDPDVPAQVIADDVKVFRSTLNFLTNALQRTDSGSVCLMIRVDHNVSLLLFECEDTGEDIPVDDYPVLFQPCRSEDGEFRICLANIASLVSSMGGEYGFRPRCVGPDGNILTDSMGNRIKGSVFWFSLPLNIPDPANMIQEQFQQNMQISNNNNPMMMMMGNNNQFMGGQDMEMANALQGTSVGSAFDVSASCTGNTCEDTIINLSASRNASRNNLLSASITDLDPFPLEDLAQGPVPAGIVRKKRALVIDDSAVVRKSLLQTLNNLDYNVTLAADGMEGMRAMQRCLFDIVFCDFLMPGMDGISCVKQYREWEQQNRQWFRQLIIGISAHNNVNNNGQGIEAGMDDFRPKPISTKTVKDLQSTERAIYITEKLDKIEGSASRSNQPDNEVSNANYNNPSFSTQENQACAGKHPQSNQPAALILVREGQDYDIPGQFEAAGWQFAIANSTQLGLQYMQMRSWNLILIDHDIESGSGAGCITAFRSWEENNRNDIQDNIFLLCDGDIPPPSDSGSMDNAPDGCTGLLRKPIPWNDLQFVMQRSQMSTS